MESFLVRAFITSTPFLLIIVRPLKIDPCTECFIDTGVSFLQRYGLNGFDPQVLVVTKLNESCDYVEHLVTETTDIKDVLSVMSLRGSVWSDVNADKLCIRVTSLELVPLSHRSGATVMTGINP